MFILGTKILKNLKVIIGFKKIYGIGMTTSKKICRRFGFQENMLIQDIPTTKWRRIAQIVSKRRETLTKVLKKKEKQDLRRLVNIRSYIGTRHRYGLSVRGQRTHSNCQTQRRVGRKRFNLALNIRNFSVTVPKIVNSYLPKEKISHKNTIKLCLKYLRRIRFSPKKGENLSIRRKAARLEKIKSIPWRRLSRKQKNILVHVKERKKKNRHIFFQKFAQNYRVIEYQYSRNIFIRNCFRASLGYRKSFKKTPIKVIVLTKATNLLVYVYFKNKLKYWFSGGCLGLRGRNRSTFYASNRIINNVVERLQKAKNQTKDKKLFINLCFKGRHSNLRRSIIKKLKLGGIRLCKITDKTAIAHGGCRLKKLRR